VPGKYYLTEQSSDPPVPSGTKGVIYAKGDNKLYYRNDAGEIYDLTATGGIETRSNYWPDYSGDTPKIYFSELDMRLWVARKYLTHLLCLEDAFRGKYDWSKSISFFLFDATSNGNTIYNLADGSGMGDGTAYPSPSATYTDPEPYALAFGLDGARRIDLGSLSSTFSSGHTIIVHFASLGTLANDPEVVLKFASSGGEYFTLMRGKMGGATTIWRYECNGRYLDNTNLAESTDRVTVCVRQTSGTPGSLASTYIDVLRGNTTNTTGGAVFLPSDVNYTLNCIGASNDGGGSYSCYFTNSQLLAVIHIREYLHPTMVSRIHRILTRWASNW